MNSEDDVKVADEQSRSVEGVAGALSWGHKPSCCRLTAAGGNGACTCGGVDTSAWQDAEFAKPLYAAPSAPAQHEGTPDAGGREWTDDAIVTAPAPMPTAEEAWMAKYVLRMIECGIAAEDAWGFCKAGKDDHDYTDDPREAADNEMEAWDDGDLA